MMKLDVLAIGAHPDDIELTCGGTIIKLIRQGHPVGIVDLTSGELGTRGTQDTRASEAAEAGRLMGVTSRVCLGIPDGSVENSPENRLQLITSIREFRPDVLLFPYPVDRHPDHENAYRLCRDSWFFSGLEKIKTSFHNRVQEPHRPRGYFHFMQWVEFVPSFVVDVTEHYELRTQAMLCFKSQFHDPESQERETILSRPEFLEMVRTRLEYYGDKIGVRYGEPFFSPQVLKVDDLFNVNL